jgi:hypothetical protein
MPRVDRGEHMRMAQDAADTEHRDTPNRSNIRGSEHLDDARCPAALNGKRQSMTATATGMT